MSERVLVTGAGGFVCRHIVDALLADGFRVLALDRAFDDDLRARWDGRATLITAEADTPPTQPFDALVHGAALTATPQAAGLTPVAHLQANLSPALALMDRPTRRSIFISSSGVYRQTAPEQRITEDLPPDPLGMYAVAKRSIELATETLRAQHGRDVLTVRLGNVYGPGERIRDTRPNVSTAGQMVHDGLTAGVITVHNPDERRDWTYAPDIGRAVVALLRAETLNYPLYHVGAGESVTLQQTAEHIAAALPGDVTIVSGDASEPHPRQGTLASERLTPDTGFNDWTPFAAGIRHMIEEGVNVTP